LLWRLQVFFPTTPTGGPTQVWKIITGYRGHRDTLAGFLKKLFGRERRKRITTGITRSYLPKDEGLLLIFERTNFSLKEARLMPSTEMEYRKILTLPEKGGEERRGRRGREEGKGKAQERA